MSGTEFEKAAGREKAKKWKASVRVAHANGQLGEMVGDWLQVCAQDVSTRHQLLQSYPAAMQSLCILLSLITFPYNHCSYALHWETRYNKLFAVQCLSRQALPV